MTCTERRGSSRVCDSTGRGSRSRAQSVMSLQPKARTYQAQPVHTRYAGCGARVCRSAIPASAWRRREAAPWPWSPESLCRYRAGSRKRIGMPLQTEQDGDRPVAFPKSAHRSAVKSPGHDLRYGRTGYSESVRQFLIDFYVDHARIVKVVTVNEIELGT